VIEANASYHSHHFLYAIHMLPTGTLANFSYLNRIVLGIFAAIVLCVLCDLCRDHENHLQIKKKYKKVGLIKFVITHI
jgi:hypothetical protein